MIHHRAEENVKVLFQLGFSKRPREELYGLRVDPDHMNNVADHHDYQHTRKHLADKLIGVLSENENPRLVELPC